MSENNNVENNNEDKVDDTFSLKTLVKNKKVQYGLGALGVVALLSIIGFAGSKLYQKHKN